MTFVAILLFLALAAIVIEVLRAHRSHQDTLTVAHGDLSRDLAKIKAALGIEDKPE